MKNDHVEQLAKAIAEDFGVTPGDSRPKLCEDIALILQEQSGSLDDRAGRLIDLFERIADGEAPGYDAWFRAKVQASLDDPRATIPHGEVMAEARRRITPDEA